MNFKFVKRAVLLTAELISKNLNDKRTLKNKSLLAHQLKDIHGY